MESISIPFGGADITLTGGGLLWIKKHSLLCASDIHFEKSTFFSRFATLLPPYDSIETAGRLERAVRHYQPKILIALGDSFHDINAVERMEAGQVERLNNLISGVPIWHWITGNHDLKISSHIKGQRNNELMMGKIIFRHQLLSDASAPEISGHYHPKASVRIKGSVISAPCFLYGQQQPERLIMPAYGALTGGLNVDNPALLNQIPASNRKIYLTLQGEIYNI